MTQRLSDKPYTADLVFKDGTKRSLDYAMSCLNGGFFQFFASKDGVGPVVFINADAVAVLEIEESLQPAGAA